MRWCQHSLAWRPVRLHQPHPLKLTLDTGEEVPSLWKEWMAAQQQQQVAKPEHVFQLMTNQQKAMLDQMVTALAQANKQLWEQFVKTFTKDGGQKSS